MGTCLKKELNKVNICLDKYHRDHRKFPTIAVVDDKVYEFLRKEGLLKEPQSSRDVHNRAILNNNLGIGIEVHKTNELSDKEQSELEKATKDMELPLNLGRGKPSKAIKNKYRATYNLAATSSELVYI